MSAATMQASRPAIPENKTKKVTPSLIAVYVLLIVLAVVVALCMFFSGTIKTITTAKIRVAQATTGR